MVSATGIVSPEKKGLKEADNDVGYEDRSCWVGFSKFYLSAVNIIIAAVGGFLLAFGILIQLIPIDISEMGKICISVYSIIEGCCLIYIAVLALLGVCREKAKLLNLYAWLLGFLICIKMVSVIINIWNHNYLYDIVDGRQLHQIFDQYKVDLSAKDLVDELQRYMSCCGYEGPKSIMYSNGTYPNSCCYMSPDVCRTPYRQGCLEELMHYLNPLHVIYKTAWTIVPFLKTSCIFAAVYLIHYYKTKEAGQRLRYSKF